MTVTILSKDTDGNKPYKYHGIIAILTTTHQIKLIGRSNKVVNLDKDLIVNIFIEDIKK